MIIRTNKNLRVGMPAGSFSGLDPIKTDYSNLVIQDVTRIKDNHLRFNLSGQYNQHTILISAKNQEGEKDLTLIENKKDELVGKQFDDIIGQDLF